MSAPLTGITVVDFSELLPGPFFTQSLAEMGARVIKIERPPKGDNSRQMGPGAFEAINRGKSSLLVDLKADGQRAEVHSLLATADVLVESYRPGVMARFGLDYASLRETYPQLVYVSLSGYGQNGPWSGLPGHDINYLAAAGVLAVSGSAADGDPALDFGLPVADLCGAMYALSSTLAALLQRQTTGVGQHLDVALADCALHWMNPRLGAYRAADALTVSSQRNVTLLKPAYGVFPCREGRHVSIAALEDHFWQKLCAVLDLGQYAAEAYRSLKARKEVALEINARIARELATRDADEVFAQLMVRDIPAAPVVGPSDVMQLPQFSKRGLFEDGSMLPLVRYPVQISGMASNSLCKSPALDDARASVP